MLKKVWCIVLISVFLICSSMPVFAVPGGEEEQKVVNETDSALEAGDTTDTSDESIISEETTGKDTMDKTESTEDSGDEADTEAVEETEEYEVIIDNIVYDQYIEETGQFLVTITRPESNETTFKKSYVICGVAEETDIKVVLAIKNEETGEYEYFKNVDGYSSWDIGSFGIFTKEVALENGPNNLKIIAYRKSETDNLVVGENVQVSYYTITVLKESIKDKIMRSILEFTDIFEGLEDIIK